MGDVPKHKAAQNCQILPWLSAKPNCREGRFLQIGNSLLLSKAFQDLSAGAQMTYLAMALESGGHSGFVFPLGAARKYGLSESSFSRYVKELTQKGFISLVYSGRVTREPNKYRFSLEWKSAGDHQEG